MLDSLVNSLALTFALIAITLMFHMRSVRAGLLSGLVLVLPVAVVFGLMSWYGQVLEIGTMLAGPPGRLIEDVEFRSCKQEITCPHRSLTESNSQHLQDFPPCTEKTV